MFGSDLTGVAPHILIRNSAPLLILTLFAVDILKNKFSEGSRCIFQNGADNLIPFHEKFSFLETVGQHGQPPFVGGEAVLLIGR